MKCKTIFILTILTSIAGCTSNKESLIPQEGLTAKEVYYGQYRGEGEDTSVDINAPKERFVPKRALEDHELRLDAYALHSMNKPEYRLLPNPTMYLFVNSRLSSQDRIPMPSYITEFKLLTRDEYALPGEFLAVEQVSTWSNKEVQR